MSHFLKRKSAVRTFKYQQYTRTVPCVNDLQERALVVR